jgi:hypothetical protein
MKIKNALSDYSEKAFFIWLERTDNITPQA